MKKLSLLFILLLTINTISSQPEKTILTVTGRGCSGSESYSACKNCSGCKHCAKEGGSCGVCRPATKKKITSKKTTK